jgi:hypothetical protein
MATKTLSQLTALVGTPADSDETLILDVSGNLTKKVTVENLLDGILNKSALVFPNLPTSDPINAGQLYNDAGTLKISLG